MPQLYELNLRDYWNIFLKRRLIMIISFFGIFLSVFFYTALQSSVYSASVLIKIDPALGMPSEIVFPSNYRYIPENENNLSDYTRQIVSSPVIEQAAKELGLITDNMSENDKNSVVNNISNDVEALEIEKTNMIRLQVRSQNPEMAANLANRIAIIFKKLNAEQKNQRAYNVRTFIEKTLEDVSAKLKEQDERLRTLTMQGALGTGVNTVNQVYTLEQKRAELLTRFTEKHPDVISIDEQITELKKDLKSLPKEEFEYGILKRDITVNEKLYTSLKEKLPEAQIKEAEKIDNVLIVNPAATPRYPTYPNKKKNYTMGILLGVIFSVTTALVTEHIDTSIGRVEDIESFIKVSVLGVIPFFSPPKDEAAIKEERKWRSPWGRIFKHFKRRGARQKEAGGPALSALEQTSGSIFLEAFRILGVNLQVLFGKGEKMKNKIVLITSCNPEEGKSIVTSNLSIILAQMGYRVLLIDADTRRANIHKIFGLKHKEGGLLDILTGKVSAEAAIRTATDLMLGATSADKVMDRPWLNNLNILTAGSVFPNPINLFNSAKLDETLNFFKTKYDIILIDSSPILAVSDPSILIPKVDGVLLVYKAGATSRIALRRAKMQIESVQNKPLAGIVLNNVTPEVGMDTYYYYNKRYYGERDEGSGKKMEGKGGGANV